jgi:ubiquinone/menaquinone biosynthesis C-methylase UbiE
MVNKANIEHFSVFSRTYNRFRPRPPHVIVDTILKYLPNEPKIIVDIGCGTGLSTFIWKMKVPKVIGIEPNYDFRNFAVKRSNKKGNENISFVDGDSTHTTLGNESVDIITCSQSFHWMEPTETLKEFSRILKPNGVIGIYDCEWPPVMGNKLEKLYIDLIDRSSKIYNQKNKHEKISQVKKSEHFNNVMNSGYFSYVREVFLHISKNYSAESIVGLTLSQGSIQTVINRWNNLIKDDINNYRESVYGIVQKKKAVILCYRLIIGIK